MRSIARSLARCRYKPETKQDKAKRLKSAAETRVAGKKAETGKKVRAMACRA